MAHTKVTKAYSANTGTANTFSYSGSFDVFKGTEVIVLLDGTALTFTSSTINESASPREYTVDISAKTIHIGGADLSSGTITIRPETDMGAPTPRATYTPGASVASDDLNNNQLQLMRKAMEYDETKLSTTGDTMTGDLTMGESTKVIFEGATDDGYETTFTVTDPTADRTITLPNVTGTVVTTGDTGTVDATMLAANSVDSSELVDGSIDTSHIADSQVTTAKLGSSAVTTVKLATDAVTGAKIADDSIDSEHYVDGSIDTAHIADSQITSAKIADGTIVAGDLASDAVTTAKITDLNVTTAKIAADAITGAKIADDAVDSEHLAADSIDAEHYAAGSVDTTALGADAVTGAKIADDAIDSEHYTDGSIDTAHIAGSQVTAAKLASNSVETSKITDANVTTAKIADDAITIGKIGCEQTTISDSDSHIPTSGAVVDYVAAQIAPIGGLEVIADEDNFPTSQPASGVVISISDAAGIVVSGSGSSTTARTAGNGSDNVTINNFPSSLYSETLASGVGLMVSSTGSSNIYNYHKILAAETDVKQLSDDINDFNARYRVNAGEPGSNNDQGDLVFDTSASKMKVYDGSSWGEVTSTGEFKYLFLCPAGGSGAPTLDGSIATYDLRESSNSGSAASVTNAAQLLVSVNGVVQKANTGTSAPSEGFALVDANTIIFGANLASGDSVFIVQIGSAVSIPTPGDGTVSAAKIASGAVTTAKIADDGVTQAKIADDAVGADQLASSAVVTASIVDDAVTSAKIADDAITSALIADDAITSALIADDAVVQAAIADDAVNEARLQVSNSPTNGQFLSAQSGNTGGLTWADVASVGQARNLIINGAMNVAQRNTSSTTEGYTTVDRFSTEQGGVDEGPTREQADVAAGTTPYTLGFRKCLKITNGNQTSGAGTSDRVGIGYKIEAQDIATSGWNYLSSSSYITISYWVKSSVAQNFYNTFGTDDGTSQRYVTETGSLSADTWTKITKTIPGNSNLTFNNDNGEGLEITWECYRGTSQTGTRPLNAWAAADNNTRTPDQTSTWWTTNDATFEITGVQLEIGSTANDFAHESYDDTLKRCQRYFNMIGDGTNFGTNTALSDAFMWSANEIDFMYTFPVEMRTTPSLYQVTGADYFQVQGDGANTHIDGSFTLQYACKRSTSQYAGSDSSRTQGNSCHITVKNSAARYGYTAEL